MPRPKKESDAEPKKRSRTGCWPCKARKVKCGEEKPACTNCVKSKDTCDYSIRLNWGGRSKRGAHDGAPMEPGGFTFVTTPNSAGGTSSPGGGHEHLFSAQHIATAPQRPPSSHPSNLPTPEPTPGGNGAELDPRLRWGKHSPQDFKPSLHGGPPYLPSFNATSYHSPASSDRSPPTSAPASDDFPGSPQHSAKRVKLSPTTRASQALFAIPPYPPPTDIPTHSIGGIMHTPATPTSGANAGSPFLPQPPPPQPQNPPDLRRLSVKSLLSDPSEGGEPRPTYSRSDSHGYRTYGYDHGLEDRDIPHNDDMHVVQPKSPDLRRASAAVSEVSTSSGEIDAKQIAFEPGGYYAQPVPIKIPRILEPLPDELVRNPMNLMYFHHFINHTGRIMVPHDCPENPFRGVLAQMAVRNPHLLHLVLSFSASHRARLLDHPEPAKRIAEWMSDVIPALRRSLDIPSSPGVADPRDPSSLAPLATAIMLASLEIISPNTFSVSISWQNHLQIARNIIVAKGGLHHLAQQADGARDKAIFFLSRWFAYLDVMGSLSGSKQEQPLFGAYLEDGGGMWLVNRSDDEIYQIDCFFGFSGRCIALLAQVAELAARCDRQRIDPITNQVKVGWRPPPDARQQAEDLRKRLDASATTVYRGCMHADPHATHIDAGRNETDVEEICATNEAFHWAGKIHLARRVLALPAHHPDVQVNVQKVIASLSKIRRGSSAESCLLFPMFSAGCEAESVRDRELFMDRLKVVGSWGMENVGRARSVMQTVWDTGKPWETIVDGEFFG